MIPATYIAQPAPLFFDLPAQPSFVPHSGGRKSLITSWLVGLSRPCGRSRLVVSEIEPSTSFHPTGKPTSYSVVRFHRSPSFGFQSQILRLALSGCRFCSTLRSPTSRLLFPVCLLPAFVPHSGIRHTVSKIRFVGLRLSRAFGTVRQTETKNGSGSFGTPIHSFRQPSGGPPSDRIRSDCRPAEQAPP